jgi:hypothetical protein
MGFLVDEDRRYLPLENGYFIQRDFFVSMVIQDQDTRLRMPNKWHIFQEGQAGNKIDNAAACLCFLIYLAFLRPAADRAVSILPWVVRRGRSYGFLWAGSIIQKNVRKENPSPAYF